jgi:hypothetical protein
MDVGSIPHSSENIVVISPIRQALFHGFRRLDRIEFLGIELAPRVFPSFLFFVWFASAATKLDN